MFISLSENADRSLLEVIFTPNFSGRINFGANPELNKCHSRAGGNLEKISFKTWIPASAGMTMMYWIPAGVYPCENRSRNDICVAFSLS